MKTQADCYRALLDGKTLYAVFGAATFVSLVDGNQATSTRTLAFSFDTPTDWYIKQEWYEDESNFPIICYIKDNAQDESFPAIVTSYDKTLASFITSKGNKWNFAEPLPIEDFANNKKLSETKCRP